MKDKSVCTVNVAAGRFTNIHVLDFYESRSRFLSSLQVSCVLLLRTAGTCLRDWCVAFRYGVAILIVIVRVFFRRLLLLLWLSSLACMGQPDLYMFLKLVHSTAHVAKKIGTFCDVCCCMYQNVAGDFGVSLRSAHLVCNADGGPLRAESLPL